jgi:hypothetical protein
MTQPKGPGESFEIVRRHLADIRAWQAQGKTARAIAKQLGLPETSYRRALVNAEKEESMELSTYLPVLRELQELLPLLKPMAKQWSEQQTLAQIPEEYKKYGPTYSVRLSERLIEDLKEYAQRHRLSQSEVVTVALQQLLARE